MLCLKCSSLAILEIVGRICVRCQGSISNNLSCICDNCSTEQRVCSICLKKSIQSPEISLKGCGCGKKK